MNYFLIKSVRHYIAWEYLNYIGFHHQQYLLKECVLKKFQSFMKEIIIGDGKEDDVFCGLVFLLERLLEAKNIQYSARLEELQSYTEKLAEMMASCPNITPQLLHFLSHIVEMYSSEKKDMSAVIAYVEECEKWPPVITNLKYQLIVARKDCQCNDVNAKERIIRLIVLLARSLPVPHLVKLFQHSESAETSLQLLRSCASDKRDELNNTTEKNHLSVSDSNSADDVGNEVNFSHSGHCLQSMVNDPSRQDCSCMHLLDDRTQTVKIVKTTFNEKCLKFTSINNRNTYNTRDLNVCLASEHSGNTLEHYKPLVQMEEKNETYSKRKDKKSRITRGRKARSVRTLNRNIHKHNRLVTLLKERRAKRALSKQAEANQPSKKRFQSYIDHKYAVLSRLTESRITKSTISTKEEERNLDSDSDTELLEILCKPTPSNLKLSTNQTLTQSLSRSESSFHEAKSLDKGKISVHNSKPWSIKKDNEWIDTSLWHVKQSSMKKVRGSEGPLEKNSNSSQFRFSDSGEKPSRIESTSEIERRLTTNQKIQHNFSLPVRQSNIANTKSFSQDYQPNSTAKTIGIISHTQPGGAMPVSDGSDGDMDVIFLKEHLVKTKKERITWSPEEEERLVLGVGEYGEGKWRDIRVAYSFLNKTSQQLYDKWRNIKKYNHLSEIKLRLQAKKRVQPIGRLML